MNKITAIHVVDATGQHATFYGYDENGRVSKVWTMRNNQGYDRTMTPVRPTLISSPMQTDSADMEIAYDMADAVASVRYPTAGVSTSYKYNELGSLMRSVTQPLTTPTTTLFEQRLSYWPSGLIYEQWTNTDGSKNHDEYTYDDVQRLSRWTRNHLPYYGTSRQYHYDRIGNRTMNQAIVSTPPDPTTYTYGLVSSALQPNTLRTVTSVANSFTDAMTYDDDGAMLTRQRDRTTDGMRTQRLETYSYDAFNLVERFTLKHDATMVAGGEGCLPDASTKPVDDFRYRFGPLQEREQKRQYATSNNIALDGLAWTYTLLGADAKQLATYNGVQGNFCGQPANTVWMWPVEFNSYGPAQSRIITRSNGAREYVIADHLGSSRLTLSSTGEILQRTDYQPFGIEINEAGTGSRTSYIGREKDNESDLGMYGVRMYEPEYGRFMSVDPLWGKRPFVQPYEYAGNNPITAKDPDGGDYDIIVDDENQTITVSAIYFATAGDADAANKAIAPINALSGTEVEYNGKKYVVNFALVVETVDNPNVAMTDAKFTVTGEGDLIELDVANVNTFKVSSAESGDVRSGAAGTTTFGRNVFMLESYALHEGAPTHEILHSLGIDHRMFGIMAKSISDKNWSPAIHIGLVEDVVRQKDAGKGVGVGTVRNAK